MELTYQVEKVNENANVEAVWGCFAGCCTFVDRGIDY